MPKIFVILNMNLTIVEFKELEEVFVKTFILNMNLTIVEFKDKEKVLFFKLFLI